MPELAGRHWRIQALLFAAVLSLYLAYPTRDFYWDGTGFALTLDHPGWFGMIEANHPIYVGFGWLIHSLVQLIVPVRGLTLLQALNSVLGAVSVTVFYGIAKELLADELDALLFSGLFAFSATWWKFTTDADAYIPSVLLLLVAARLLLPGHKARPVLVALVHTGAMLFHELAVMFTVAAAVGICLQDRDNRRKAERDVAVYLSTAFALSSAAYYTCFRLSTGQADWAGYLRWITGHTPDSNFSFGLARDAWLTIRGTARLAVGGRIGAFHSGLVEVGGLLLLLVLGGVLLWKAGPDRERHSALPGAAALWVSWIVVYMAFLFVWLPQNTFYRLFYLPPFVVLTGTALRHWGGRRALCAVTGVLGAWNFLFYIRPHSLVETNPVARAAVAMQTTWKPGAWVYQGSFNPDNWAVFCFSPKVLFKGLDLQKLNETAGELRYLERTGHETWIDQSGIDLLKSSEAGSQWLREHTRPGFKREFRDSKHNAGFDRLFP